MSLVRLAHSLWGLLDSWSALVYLLLNCIWSLPVSVCSWFCSSNCFFLLFPSPISGIDGFSTYLGNEVNISGPGSSVMFDSPASVIPRSSAELITLFKSLRWLISLQIIHLSVAHLAVILDPFISYAM